MTLQKPKLHWRPPRSLALTLVILSAAILTAVMLFVRAASQDVVLEAEQMTLSGSGAVQSDVAASGGKSVRFSAGAGGGSGSGGQQPNCAGETPGQLQLEESFKGASTGVDVPYAVSLPADYYTACKTYPVLYYLHGKGDSYSIANPEAQLMRGAVTAGVMDEVIIVTPDSYVDGRWENGGNGPAEDNFIKELIPYIESHYRVKAGPSYRLLSGFSMGGHGAFRFGVKYPKMFAAVYSVDGAMGDASDYTQFIDGVKAGGPQIITVGGQGCGYRVEPVVDAFKGMGVTFSYAYYDVTHDFRNFIDEDQKAGWPAMKFLQSNLGRAVQ